MVYLGDEFLLLRVDLEVYLLLVVDGNAFVLLCLFHVNEFGLLKLPRHGYLIPGQVQDLIRTHLGHQIVVLVFDPNLLCPFLRQTSKALSQHVQKLRRHIYIQYLKVSFIQLDIQLKFGVDQLILDTVDFETSRFEHRLPPGLLRVKIHQFSFQK